MQRMNNKGIALITALMLTFITLVIILAVLYMISNNTKSSAGNKAYRNATEAAYGGADLLLQDVIPRLFANRSSSSKAADVAAGLVTANSMLTDYGGSTKLDMVFGSNACLQQKLNNSVSGWSACPGDRVNPKPNFDMKFNLTGLPGQPGFTVYSKIIDTLVGVPYPPPPPGGVLLGGGVTESSAGSTTILTHYVYRIEVTGERSINPSEKSNLSILYEY